MNETFLLAEAVRFTTELRRRATKQLSIAIGLRTIVANGNVSVEKRVSMGDEHLGILTVTHNPVSCRITTIHWHGRIPGYRNPCGSEMVVLSWSHGRRTDHNCTFTEFP